MATPLLIIVNIICFLLQISVGHSADIVFGLNSLFLDRGFYHQVFTTMFMHGSIMHIAMNMVVLYQFGSIIERYKGTKFFISLYLVGGVLTSLLSFAFFYSLGLHHNLVGASGAISVLIGYIALKDKFNRQGLIVMILLISFAPLLLGMNIAWYAHIIGFIIGMLVGLRR
jgi:membrane associated rhomboid family serine protease